MLPKSITLVKQIKAILVLSSGGLRSCGPRINLCDFGKKKSPWGSSMCDGPEILAHAVIP